jgi:prefoldin subunit 5
MQQQFQLYVESLQSKLDQLEADYAVADDQLRALRGENGSLRAVLEKTQRELREAKAAVKPDEQQYA